MSIRNPFRRPDMRQIFASWVECYQRQGKNLFHGDVPHRGNAWAAAFWAGFDGLETGLWAFTATDRSLPIYAIYRAGKAVRASSDQSNGG